MTRDERPRPAPGEALERGAREGRRGGIVGSRLPTGLACRLLSCSLEAPEAVSVGEPTPFYFHVKNRAPIGLTLECPSSRVWGWTVDDVPEAGAGRFEPPEAPATVAFGPRERRTFTGRWDGRFLESDGNGDRWASTAGTHTLTAYLAVEDWRRRRTFSTARLAVRSAQG